MPLLQLDGVTAGYGPTVILENVTLGVAQGEAVAVLGRNGVGKTTLMRTIAGQTRLHGGALRLAGEDISRLPGYQRCRKGIGYVPQTRDVFASLTVEENLLVAAQPGAWTLERVYDLFPNLATRRGNGGNQISGGEQQMLSIGRALMGNPRVLLLDEPMEGLAPVIVEKLFDVFQILRDSGSFALVLVEQYVNLALNFARRTVVLDRGRVVFDGSSGELASNPDMMANYFGATGHGAPAEGRSVHA